MLTVLTGESNTIVISSGLTNKTLMLILPKSIDSTIRNKQGKVVAQVKRGKSKMYVLLSDSVVVLFTFNHTVRMCM